MILEAINELVHLELLTDSEFAANVNFSSSRNLASNELFLYYSTYIAPEAADETCAAYLFRYPLTLGS